MKIITLRINKDEYDLLLKAVELSYDETKHKKHYGISAFIKESAVPRAKKIISNKK